MTTRPETAAVTVRMCEMAEERGLWGAGWRDAWWWDDEQLRDALTPLIERGDGVSVRLDASDGGGSIWTSLHPMDGRAMRLSASSDTVLPGRRFLSGSADARAARSENPGQWVTWYNAHDAIRGEVHKPVTTWVVKRGDWVGGITSNGAMLAQAWDVDEKGRPTRVIWDHEVVPVPAKSQWFSWTGAARRHAAEKLVADGRADFPGYLHMRSAVLHQARKLIKAGTIPNDEENPIRMTWSRQRKAKPEK